jgi:RsiW-degrading membrane proteinase PrsW (M82 family)
MGLIPGIVLASVIPLGILGIICKSDFYQIGKYHLILRSLFWGILAYLVASLVNSSLKNSWADAEAIREIFIAPPLEELLKGLVLLYLIRRSKITFSVDGALYGFATGIGFAIAENFGYIFYAQADAIDVALKRIFSANLVHATSSAILGIALGMSYLRRIRSRRIFLAASLSLAIVLHMFYNFMVIQGGASLASAFGIGILGSVFIYLAMQRGKKQAQDWIREMLGMRDGVTPGEVALVNRLPNTDDLLQPVFERFGFEKAGQVEKLLYLQARLGIKRKFLDSIPKDDPLRIAVEKELREMQTEMLATERAIGIYTMLFVRGLYTDEMVSVWERMQAKIRERSAGNGGQTGGGLWSSLDERINR